MRLRLQTLPPLPALKAWFIPDLPVAPSTIHNLKEAICQRVQVLQDGRIAERHIDLILDEFELLSDSPLAVVRDGDLVYIKKSASSLSPEVGPSTRKRKRSLSPRRNVRPQLHANNTPIVMHDEDSSSSDSDSTSSSTSSSTSTSSSSSSSSSSSTSSPSSSSLSTSPPILQSSKPVPHTKKSSTVQNVAPGFGKPTTRNRNLRRRIKRQHDKVEANKPAPAAPKGSSLTNTVPLGPRQPQNSPSDYTAAPQGAPGADTVSSVEDVGMARTPQTINEGSGQVMMSSLRNKNKKKGYKQTLGGPIPAKIVFDLQDAPTPARLVPPSEIQEQGNLPANMFVTSVDVEAGLWSKTKKGKRKEQELYGEWASQEGWYEEGGENQIGEVADVVDVLPYGDAEEDQTLVANQLDLFDWGQAEKVWEKSAEVQNMEELIVGRLVGWKNLAINPRTYTPEFLLFLARVIEVKEAPVGYQVTVQQLKRAGSKQAMFSFEEDVAEETEIHDWTNVSSSKWRIVDI